LNLQKDYKQESKWYYAFFVSEFTMTQPKKVLRRRSKQTTSERWDKCPQLSQAAEHKSTAETSTAHNQNKLRTG
jgi:hypothetical protein